MQEEVRLDPEHENTSSKLTADHPSHTRSVFCAEDAVRTGEGGLRLIISEFSSKSYHLLGVSSGQVT